jgi:hemolysin activation/secretion protein
VPEQTLWRLDSSSMLRGYPRGTAVGERYWRTRAELGYQLPWSLRLFVFGDAAWAGPRTRFDTDGTLTSLGIGYSQFNGLVRADLAYGLTAPGGLRLHVRINPRL